MFRCCHAYVMVHQVSCALMFPPAPPGSASSKDEQGKASRCQQWESVKLSGARLSQCMWAGARKKRTWQCNVESGESQDKKEQPGGSRSDEPREGRGRYEDTIRARSTLKDAHWKLRLNQEDN